MPINGPLVAKCSRTLRLRCSSKKYYLDASTDTLRNSLRSLVSSRADLRARVPAALLPFSTCSSASLLNASTSAWILATSSFMG